MDPDKIVAEITASMDAMKKANAAITKELQDSVAKNGQISADSAKLTNELSTKLQGCAAQILELEQKLAENVKRDKAPIETLGQMVIKSDAFKQYAAGGVTKMRIEANTIIGQEGSPQQNSSTIVAPDRQAGIIPGAFRLLKIRDIIPQGNTGSNLVQYTRELAFTNDAAETAEAASKPESALTFELVNCPIQTIAHFLKISKQVLADAPALQSYIDVRLRYGVEYRIDSQILNGDGTGQNISGMRDSGNYTPFTPLTGENALDSLNRAIYLVYAADYAPTAIIMNPADWGALERIKVGGSDNLQSYVIGNPTGILGPQIWGLPVVLSNAMPAGNFLVGSMPIAYQFWNRATTVVEIFEQDSDNVTKNLLTVRAEARGALATYRPASVRAGALTL